MSLLGAGPKTTTTSTNTALGSNSQTSQGTNTTNASQTGQTQGTSGQQFGSTSTPNVPDWYKNFLSAIPGQYQGLAGQLQSQATKPLYGQQQQANFQNQLAHQTTNTSKDIQSQLASQGALNSGRSADVQTAAALGGQQQLSNYLAQVPQQNAQYQTQQQQALSNLIGQQQGFTSPISAYGQTAAGTQQGQTGQTQQSQQQSIQQLLQNILSSNTSQGQQTQQTQTNPFASIFNNLIGAGGQGLGAFLGGL